MRAPSYYYYYYSSIYLCLDGPAQRTARELLIPTAAATAAHAATTATTAATASAAAALLPLKGVGGALCALLERLLVGLDETRRLVREAERQRLEAAELDALPEDDGRVDLVERGAWQPLGTTAEALAERFGYRLRPEPITSMR